MPTSGLSLVGFMEEALAVNHLRNVCIPPDASDAAIRAAWQGAQAGCAAPAKNAGLPSLSPIPASHAPYIAALTQTPMVAQALQTYTQGSSFQMVEIDPLLAYQHMVDLDHITQQCRGLGAPPSMDELLALCLPMSVPQPTVNMSPSAQSILLKTRALNLTTLGGGIFQNPNQPTIAGIAIGPALPLVHVVRLNGRCFLHNGFHRAVGARMAGATEIPCLFRDVLSEEAVGIRQDGSTFASSHLNGANPPTVGHFTLLNAHKVQLRARSRVLHLSWGEHIVYDE